MRYVAQSYRLRPMWGDSGKQIGERVEEVVEADDDIEAQRKSAHLPNPKVLRRFRDFSIVPHIEIVATCAV